jgi:hypothetical protein
MTKNTISDSSLELNAETTISEDMTANKESQNSTHKPGKFGLCLIGAGVICCLAGFVLLLNSSFDSTTFNVSLYGLTGMGGSSIMGGLFLLLG